MATTHPDISKIKKNDFVKQEDNLKKLALSGLELASKALVLASIGKSAMAIVKGSSVFTEPKYPVFLADKYNDALKFTDKASYDSINAIDYTNVYCLLGGAALYGIISLSKSEPVGVINDIFASGADRVMQGDHTNYTAFSHTDYKKVMAGKVVSQYADNFINKIAMLPRNILDTLNVKTLEPSYANNPNIDREKINLLHLTAMYGQSDSQSSKEIKKNIADVDIINDVLENSDEICDLLAGNTDNLKVFLKEIENSLGAEATYFLENANDVIKGKEDLFAISIDAIKSASKSIQSYNVHQEFGAIIERVVIKSVEGKLTQSEIDTAKASLKRYENLDGLDGNAFDNVRTKAKDTLDLLEKYQPLSVIPFYKIIDNKLKLNISMKSKNFKDLVRERFFPDVEKITDPEKQIKKEIFKKMESIANKHIFSEHTDPNKLQTKSKPEIAVLKAKLGVGSNDPLNSGNIAKQAVLDVQQRMLQSIMVKQEQQARDEAKFFEGFGGPG
jgi:hypothetical protein